MSEQSERNGSTESAARGAANHERQRVTLQEVRALHDLPLPELLFRAQSVHRQHHAADEVQLCTLLSVKTGGCPEDCAYCPQSSHYETDGQRREDARRRRGARRAARARARRGATRFCMGAAWREVKDGPAFDACSTWSAACKALGLEACVHARHAHRRSGAPPQGGRPRRLQPQPRHLAASTTSRSSPRAPTTIASTRSTHVRNAGITVCSGGIIGMGESIDDRCAMLSQLAALDPHPESVPINALVARRRHAARRRCRRSIRSSSCA